MLFQGKTVCDVVSEARRKHQEAEGVVFDQAAALLLEMQYYRQQRCVSTHVCPDLYMSHFFCMFVTFVCASLCAIFQLILIRKTCSVNFR